MPTIILLDNSIYELGYYFIIYSILGWLMESTINTMRHKTFINRGFFTGFYCPIYGFGICLIYICCFPFSSNPFLVFLVGMFLATTLEYITGLLMEKIFHASWWDYSHYRFNVHGRICLPIALAWGMLSVIFICYIQPCFTALVRLIPQPIGHIFLYLFTLIFLIDLVYSIYNATKLSVKISSLFLLGNELVNLLEQSKLLEAAEDIKKRMELSKMNHTLVSLLDKLKLQLSDSSDHKVAKLHQATLSLYQKFQTHLSKYSIGEKRLLKAFPNLTHFTLKRQKSMKTHSEHKHDEDNH